MSSKTFKPTIWSKTIYDKAEEKGALVQDCNREYEGDVEYAHSVKILGVGDVTVGNYVGQDIVYEEMKTFEAVLDIDVSKYFATEIPDLDKAQANPALFDSYTTRAANSVVLQRDKYVGALVAGKAQSSEDEEAKNSTYKPGAVNVITATNKTRAAIRAAFDAAMVKLKENNFIDPGVIETAPADYALFRDDLVELKTSNDDLIRRGVVGTYYQYEVKETNNIYRDENFSYAIVRSKRSVAFAGQIHEVEGGRMQNRFSDFVRGLNVFGAKIIDQDELVVVKIPLVATA